MRPESQLHTGHVVVYVLVAEVLIMVSVFGLLRGIFGFDRKKRKSKRTKTVWADEAATPIQNIFGTHQDPIACMACDDSLIVSACLDGVVKVRVCWTSLAVSH